MERETRPISYRITRDYYETYFREFLQQSGFAEPATLVQFKITLPFALQLSQLELSFAQKDGNCCDLYFINIPWREPHHYGEASEEILELPENRCQCDLCFITADTAIEGEAVSSIFDLLVKQLNDFLSAYKLATHDYLVYPIDLRALESLYVYNIVTVDGWKEQKGILLLHDKMPFIQEATLDGEKIRDIIRLTQMIQRGENPFATSAILLADAYRFLHYGELRQAVINAQTGMEGFITTLYRELLKRQKPPIQNQAKRLPFIQLVKQELPRLLGCSLDIADTDSPAGQWYQSSYLLRNKVVHEGYMPVPPEAREAVDNAQKFQLLLVEWLKEKDNALAMRYFSH